MVKKEEDRIIALKKFPRKFIIKLLILFLIAVLFVVIIKNFLPPVIGDDAASYFYTLSSIVQGFTALLSIVIVIVVFQFQNLLNGKNRLSELNKRLIFLIRDYHKETSAENKEKYAAKHQKIYQKLIREIKPLEHWTLQHKITIEQSYFIPTVTTFTTIIIALIGLIIYPIIKNINLIPWMILIFSLFLSIWSLYEIINFIRKYLVKEGTY